MDVRWARFPLDVAEEPTKEKLVAVVRLQEPVSELSEEELEWLAPGVVRWDSRAGMELREQLGVAGRASKRISTVPRCARSA